MTIQEIPGTAARLKVVQPGDGRTGGLVPGVGVVFKIDGADSGGALSIVEHPFAVGALVPAHVHTREDEYSIVLEGEIGFRSTTARSSSARAATSSSRAARSTPCGTPARHRPA